MEENDVGSFEENLRGLFLAVVEAFVKEERGGVIELPIKLHLKKDAAQQMNKLVEADILSVSSMEGASTLPADIAAWFIKCPRKRLPMIQATKNGRDYSPLEVIFYNKEYADMLVDVFRDRASVELVVQPANARK